MISVKDMRTMMSLWFNSSWTLQQIADHYRASPEKLRTWFDANKKNWASRKSFTLPESLQ